MAEEGEFETNVVWSIQSPNEAIAFGDGEDTLKFDKPVHVGVTPDNRTIIVIPRGGATMSPSSGGHIKAPNEGLLYEGEEEPRLDPRQYQDLLNELDNYGKT